MKEEQIDKLLKIIEENGFATVKYIAKAVYASESTVRRQLTTLERMGLIVRSYGGAELKKDSVNTPIELRLQKNHRQKDIIAKKRQSLLKKTLPFLLTRLQPASIWRLTLPIKSRLRYIPTVRGFAIF